MRITIEIDAEGQTVTARQDEQQGPAAQAGAQGAMPHADVLAAAAAVGAQNAGAAPSFAGQMPGEPEPMAEVGQQMAGMELGTASAGAAPAGGEPEATDEGADEAGAQ